MSDAYYLPPKTAGLLTTEAMSQCKNLGLILDKYPPQTAVENNEGKGAWLRALNPTTHVDAGLVTQAYMRWRMATLAMQAHHFKAKTDWRMVAGLGGNTVLETDLTLHHLYGIPIIPGSALKGLTSAYARDEKKDAAAAQRIFGTEVQAGNVIFFDAMPFNGNAEIDLDIMNPHYPNYYGGEDLPTNTQNPKPVYFLAVKPDTAFMFALASRWPKDTGDMELAKTWLQDALEKYGVGGKTSAGYGLFTPVPYVRPNIPKFTAGQGIPGTVVAPTDELRYLVPGAKALLRFREFPTSAVLIVVHAEEAANWTQGQTRNCLFVREEERSGCTLLICQPIANRRSR